MPIINQTKNTVLATRVEIAETFWKRFWGLMGRTSLPEGRALVIKPCNSIHTFFMRFASDIIFLDGNGTVVKIMENLAPWRVSPIVTNAKVVVELPAGMVVKSRTEVGDVVTIL